MLPFQGGVVVVTMLCPTRCVGFYIYCPFGAPAPIIRNIEGYVVIIASCHLPEDMLYLKLKRLKAFDTYSPGQRSGLWAKPISPYALKGQYSMQQPYPSTGGFAPFFCHSTTEEWTDLLPLRAEAIAQAG